MKAILKHKCWYAVILALLVSPQAWATDSADYTYTLANEDFSSSSHTKTSGNITWTHAHGEGTESYGWDTDGYGFKFGSGNKSYPTSFTLTSSSFSNKISKVVVTANVNSKKSCKLDVKVGSTTYGEQTSITTKNHDTFTFSIADASAVSGAITLSFSSNTGPFYLEKIEVYYLSASSGYSITYHCNDATSGCPSNATGQTKLPSTLSTPSKTGFTFGGWYTDASFTTAAVAGATLSANVDLYAKWTCTINYSIGGTAYTTTGIEGENILDKLPANPSSCEATNYPNFYGWATSAISGTATSAPTKVTSGTVNSTTPSVTYYAVFTNASGGTTEYTFSSKDWNATSDGSAANWTNTSAGNGFTSGKGVQVTTGTSGANATSPVSFTNVSNIVVTYNTNKSAGAGAIKIQIGSNTEVSNDVKYGGNNVDGTSANYTTSFDFSPAQTGNVKLTTTCTTNSIWVKSIAITTAGSDDAKYITTCCSNLGQINGSVNLSQEGWGESTNMGLYGGVGETH